METVSTGKRHSASSTGLPFDPEYVRKAEQLGFDKMTAGEVMSQELNCGRSRYTPFVSQSDSKDPHKYLCKDVLGRKEMLVQTIETCLGQCFRAEGGDR